MGKKIEKQKWIGAVNGYAMLNAFDGHLSSTSGTRAFCEVRTVLEGFTSWCLFARFLVLHKKGIMKIRCKREQTNTVGYVADHCSGFQFVCHEPF